MSQLSRRLMLWGPLGLVAVGGAGFWAMLAGMRTGSFDPRGVPSALIGKPMPAFDLPGLSAADLAVTDGPVLVNFFASWCVPCVTEAPILLELKQAGVAVFGIAYKDKPEATDAFLRRHGDPYRKIGRDQAGAVAIDFGVYGVPETYLIGTGGIVRWRWAGALTGELARRDLPALLKSADARKTGG